MPTSSIQWRRRGRSATALEARVSMATSPPSPLLSARSTSTTYLIETTTVSVQKISESTPCTLWGVNCTWPVLNTSLTV